VSGRLAGKVALITGTAGGQGRAAAELFAAEGARVVGCDRKAAEAEETVARVRAAGGEMTSMAPVDLGDPDAARAWVEAAAAVYGGLDVLFNNASAPRFRPLAEMSDEDWRFTIRNELDLVFYVVSAAWPHLVARGGGSIVNTASIAGMSAMPMRPGSLAHAAAKGAVIALTRELASEGGPRRIRANSISPGTVESPANEAELAVPAIHAEAVGAIMLDRLGRPGDVAPLALYLASDESSWVTGANFAVDGGYTAR
jgi:meso-butanediol dehydrogenase/(S,S)-butanediol dehydrogenase/diacetyl reductase